MVRFFAGVAACLLMIAAAFLIWKGRSERDDGLPSAPKLGINQAAALSAIPAAPEADPKTKEQKRFDRADKDDDGKITLAELVEPRRKPFAKLDVNGDGRLSFEEWAVKTIDKFKTADADRSAALTRAEYATTAPKPKAKKPVCDCD